MTAVVMAAVVVPGRWSPAGSRPTFASFLAAMVCVYTLGPGGPAGP